MGLCRSGYSIGAARCFSLPADEIVIWPELPDGVDITRLSRREPNAYRGSGCLADAAVQVLNSRRNSSGRILEPVGRQIRDIPMKPLKHLLAQTEARFQISAHPAFW